MFTILPLDLPPRGKPIGAPWGKTNLRKRLAREARFYHAVKALRAKGYPVWRVRWNRHMLDGVIVDTKTLIAQSRALPKKEIVNGQDQAAQSQPRRQGEAGAQAQAAS